MKVGKSCKLIKGAVTIVNITLFCFYTPGKQQRCRVSAVFGEAEGVPGSAGESGAQRPGAVLTRERAFQPHHNVRAGVLAQHAKETGSARSRSLPRGRQL